VPSGKGEITEVRWKVRGVLARRKARDAIGEAALTVLSPPERYAARAAGRPGIDADDCPLELRLAPGPHVRAGETLSGTLGVAPQAPLQLQQVRLELLREEAVPLGVGNEESAVEAAVVVAEDTDLGVRTEYAFEVTAPAGLCPCLETAESTVRWWLRGVLARRLRGDYTIRQELNVYTGAGDVPAAVAAAEAADDEPLDLFRRPPGAGAEPAA
jgi:hypothetical protein